MEMSQKMCWVQTCWPKINYVYMQICYCSVFSMLHRIIQHYFSNGAVLNVSCWNWSNSCINDYRRCTLGHTNKWSLYIPVSGRQQLALHTLSHRRWLQTVTHTYRCRIHTALQTILASPCTHLYVIVLFNVFIISSITGVDLKLFRPNLPATTLLFSFTGSLNQVK